MNTKQRLFEIISKIDNSFKIDINKQLIKRIPYLKNYNILENTPDYLNTQKITDNSNYSIFIGDDMVTFKQFNLVSEIYFKKHQIRENIFYYFTVKNRFYFNIPKEIDNLTMTVFIHAIKLMSDKFSYHKEIMLKETEPFDSTTLSEIINGMNKSIYEFEEYAIKHKLDF